MDNEALRELLSYDPESGVLLWRVTRAPRRAGQLAGGVGTRYHKHVRISGKTYLAARGE